MDSVGGRAGVYEDKFGRMNVHVSSFMIISTGCILWLMGISLSWVVPARAY